MPRTSPHRKRLCSGCREIAPKTDLLRIVAVGDELVVDPGGRHFGRAAYIHRDAMCVRAASRGGLARTLRSA